MGAGPYGGDERGPCPPFAGELPAELTSPALAPPSRGSCPRSGLRGADVQRAVFICMDGERPPPALRATSPARGEVRKNGLPRQSADWLAMTGGRAVLAGRADVGDGPYGGDERGPCPPLLRGSCRRS